MKVDNDNKYYMFGIIVISFEVLVIIIFGVFLRTDTVNSFTNYAYFSQSNVFLLGYALFSLNYRRFQWTTLSHLLTICAVTFQWNTIFYIFWLSCANNTFNATASISLQNLMSSTQAILCLLITCVRVLGRISSTQLLVLCLIQNIGFSLNFVIQNYGVKMVNTGGGINVWLFAAVYSITLRFITFPKVAVAQNATYSARTMKIIGLIIMVLSWPSFNAMGSTFDSQSGDFTNKYISSGSLIGITSYYNTFAGLACALIVSYALYTHDNQVNIKKYGEAIINTGIVMAACAGLIIDPAAALLMGIFIPLLALGYEKYGQVIFYQNQPEYTLLFSILAGLLSAIFAAGRAARTPTLTSSAYQQGGLQLAAIFVTIGFSLVFAIITAYVLKLFKGVKESEIGVDEAIWMISSDMIPLYQNDPLVLYMSNKEVLKKEQSRLQEVIPNQDKREPRTDVKP